MPSGPGGKTWWRVVRREKVETTADVLFTFTTTGEVLTVSGGARALLPAFPDEWQARVPALHPGTTRSRCYAAPLLSFRARRSAGTLARGIFSRTGTQGGSLAGRSARAPVWPVRNGKSFRYGFKN